MTRPPDSMIWSFLESLGWEWEDAEARREESTREDASARDEVSVVVKPLGFEEEEGGCNGDFNVGGAG